MPSLGRKILQKLGLARFSAQFSGRLSPEPDRLPQEAWWQAAVADQAASLQDRSLDFLWLGDSITAGLGAASPEGTVFNAALGGMTTTSLVVQLQRLDSVNLQVRQAVIAMGTNDADRALSLDDFRDNLTMAIELIQGFGAHRIHLLPAHFPTPGHLWNYGWPDALTRVQQLNAQLAQIAQMAQTGPGLVYHPQFFASMYAGDRMEPTLTTDGVHLNESGCEQYRQLLQVLMATSA
jgi:lysophospholipase L1-like esterase